MPGPDVTAFIKSFVSEKIIDTDTYFWPLISLVAWRKGFSKVNTCLSVSISPTDTQDLPRRQRVVVIALCLERIRSIIR